MIIQLKKRDLIMLWLIIEHNKAQYKAAEKIGIVPELAASVMENPTSVMLYSQQENDGAYNQYIQKVLEAHNRKIDEPLKSAGAIDRSLKALMQAKFLERPEKSRCLIPTISGLRYIKKLEEHIGEPYLWPDVHEPYNQSIRATSIRTAAMFK